MSAKKRAKKEPTVKTVSKKVVSKKPVVEARNEKSGKSTILTSLVIALLGLVGYYYLTGVAGQGFLAKIGMSEYLIGRIPSSVAMGVLFLLLLMGVSVVVFFASQTGREFITYVKESRIELRRVFWPSMDETKKMTLMVLVVMVIILFFLMIVDWILQGLITLFLSFA